MSSESVIVAGITFDNFIIGSRMRARVLTMGLSAFALPCFGHKTQLWRVVS